MTQDQALNTLKKYVGDEVDSFTSYPIKATFPDVSIRARVDYQRINKENIYGIVFLASDNDICFCDTEEKTDVVYGTIKYRG